MGVDSVAEDWGLTIWKWRVPKFLGGVMRLRSAEGVQGLVSCLCAGETIALERFAAEQSPAPSTK